MAISAINKASIRVQIFLQVLFGKCVIYRFKVTKASVTLGSR